MSWLRYLTLKSFRKFNPEWKITLWYLRRIENLRPWSDGRTQDFCSFSGEDWYPKLFDLNITFRPLPEELKDIRNPVYTSDLLRLYVLTYIGGFWADMDILFLRSLDSLHLELYQGEYDTVICAHDWVSIGFLAAARTNQLYRAIYEEGQKLHSRASYYEAVGAALWTNKHFNHFQELIHKYPEHKLYNLPMSRFYGITYQSANDIFQQEDPIALPKGALGLHWYGGSQAAQRMNSILTESNYDQYPSTITALIQEVLDR